MSKLFPDRPLYRREWLIVGYPVLAAFLLLFVIRLLGLYLPLPTGSLLFKTVCELLVFALPFSVFFALRGKEYRRALRLRAPKKQNVAFLTAAFFTLLAGSVLLSSLWQGGTSLGNSATVFESVDAATPQAAVAALLALAVLPAVLEELFFRALLVAEYERRGAVRAVLMSAFLFSLSHFDVRNLVLYFCSGVLLALVLLATDSIWATVILHALYNALLLFGQRYLNALYRFTGSPELFLFLVILLLLIALLAFCKCGAKLYRARAQAEQKNPRRDVPRHVQLYTTLDALLDPPILICAVIAVIGFIVLA